MNLPKVALVMSQAQVNRLFLAKDLQSLQRHATVAVAPEGSEFTPQLAKELLNGAFIAISSWGTPRFDADMLNCAPNLRLIVHAAGSIKPVVSDEVYARGITITSGAPAIGVGVAETALGLIIIAMKNVYELSQSTRALGWNKEPGPRNRVKEMYATTVGVVGAGHVGRHLLGLLRNFSVRVLLYDPTLSPEQAQELGATLTDLHTLMAESDVVSLHAPSLPATYHMIGASQLQAMKDGAALVNTARGSLIDEQALAAELATGRIWAYLDVTDPEPPAPDNPLCRLPNVVMTPHIAGVVSTGLFRLGRYALDEVELFLAGKPALNAVRQEQLDTLA